jgi:hypothetical protein
MIKKYLNLIVFTIWAIIIFSLFNNVTNAQVSNQYWKALSGILQPVISTWQLKIPQLGGSGTKCLQTDNNGLVSTASSACGSGGGGGGTGVGWLWNSVNSLYQSTTTDDVLLGATATTSTAKLEVRAIGTKPAAYFSGNVGIGTTSPGQKLSVSGDILGNNVIGQYFTATSTTATSTLYGGLVVDGASGLNVLQNGNVAIGANNPTSKFGVTLNTGFSVPQFASQNVAHFVGADATNVTAQMDVFGGHGVIDIRRANGTLASPSALTTNDELGAFSFRGYADAASYATGGGRAAVTAYAAENWSSTNMGTYLLLSTTPLASTSLTTGMKIGPDGVSGNNSDFGVGTFGPNLFGYNSAIQRTLTIQGGQNVGSRAVLELAARAENNVSGSIIGQIDFNAQSQSSTKRIGFIAGLLTGSTAGDYGSDIVFYTKADGSSSVTEKFRINSAGKVGIGTTTPFAKLSVNPIAGDSASFVIGSSTATQFIVDNIGEVGIGTSSPGSRLAIGGIGNDTINISPTATSTFGTGINLRTGCFAINGTCVSGGAGGSGPTIAAGTNITISEGTPCSSGTCTINSSGGGGVSGGSAGMLSSWVNSTTLTATGTPTAAAYTATSTTATSTFAGNIVIGNGYPTPYLNGLFSTPTQFQMTNNVDDLTSNLVIGNTSISPLATGGMTLVNDRSTGGLYGTYYGYLGLAGSRFAAFTGLPANGLVLRATDGPIVYGATSANIASSTQCWANGSGYTVSNYDMCLKNVDTAGSIDTASSGLGLGTTTPWARLSIAASSTATFPYMVVAKHVNGSYLSSSPVFTIHQNENVGIATTTPWRPLSVNGSSDLGTNALAGTFTGTSTTATSTIGGPVIIGTATSAHATSTIVIGTTNTGVESPGCITFVTYNGSSYATSSMYMVGSSIIGEANACK